MCTSRAGTLADVARRPRRGGRTRTFSTTAAPPPRHYPHKLPPEPGPGQAVQVEVPGEVGQAHHEEELVQEVVESPRLGVLGGVVLEEAVVRHERDGQHHEGRGDEDDGDGGGRGFLLSAAGRLLSSDGRGGGQFVPGVFDGRGQLPAQDGVAADESGAGQEGVDEHVQSDPHGHPEPLVGRLAEGAPHGALRDRHQLVPEERVAVEEAADRGDGGDDDEAFRARADEVDAVGGDDGRGALHGQGHEDPGGEGGGGVHDPHPHFAHHHVAGVQVPPTRTALVSLSEGETQRGLQR